MIVPRPLPTALRDEHHAEHPRGLVRLLQRERGEEREEADDAAQQTHRGARGDDAAGVQRLAFVDRLRRADPLRRAGCRTRRRAEDEHERARAQHPRRARHLEDERRDRRRDRRADHGDDREPRVREDELVVRVDHRGHERALGDRLALREHQRAERERVEQRTVDLVRHQQARAPPGRPSRRRPSGAGRRGCGRGTGPSTGATTANGAIVSSEVQQHLGPGRARPRRRRRASPRATPSRRRRRPSPTAWASASRANGVNVVDSRRARVSVAGIVRRPVPRRRTPGAVHGTRPAPCQPEAGRR